MWTKAVSEYMDYATVHGVGRLKNSPFIILKLIWILCLCTSLGMIILQFTLLWQKFHSNPVSTTFELKSQEQLDFPVVTICNTNPVNFLSFDGNILDEILQNASKKYDLDISMFNDTNKNNSSDNISNKTIDNDILWYTAELFRMSMNKLSDGFLRNISQPMNEFILLCNYNRDNCTSTSIEEVRTYEYGLCYNIYPEFQGTDTRKVSAYGKRYGLELLLNIDSFQAVPFVTQSSSVYVMVHSKKPGSASTILTNGAVIPAGFEAEIGVSQVEKIRVSGNDIEPRCIDTDQSYLECMFTCQLEDISAMCGCTLFFTDKSIPGVYNKSVCDGEDAYLCIQGLLSSYIDQIPKVCSGCKVPCRENFYEKSVSIASWPSDTFIPILNRIVKSLDAAGNSISLEDEEDLSGTLVMLRIYLSSLSYESVKEEYSYTFVNLMSDLGGTLGLWAGFSALSLMEIFELVFLMCSTWKNRNKKVEEEQSNDTNENAVHSL